jgi:hypothetical protein
VDRAYESIGNGNKPCDTKLEKQKRAEEGVNPIKLTSLKNLRLPTSPAYVELILRWPCFLLWDISMPSGLVKRCRCWAADVDQHVVVVKLDINQELALPRITRGTIQMEWNWADGKCRFDWLTPAQCRGAREWLYRGQ